MIVVSDQADVVAFIDIVGSYSDFEQGTVCGFIIAQIIRFVNVAQYTKIPPDFV